MSIKNDEKYKLSMSIPVMLAVGVALLLGSAILYVTWEHNPQNEFHSEEGVNWGAWLPYGGIAAIIGFIVTIPLAVCVLALISSIKSK